MDSPLNALSYVMYEVNVTEEVRVKVKVKAV